MQRIAQDKTRDQARIVLDGEKVDGGIGVAVLSRTLSALSEALRLYARSLRGEPLRRVGTTTSTDEAVTDLRLVAIEPGSVQLVLEEPAPLSEPFHVPHIAMETLSSLVEAARDRSLPLEVADALERSMAPLGRNARIRFERLGAKVCIDRGRARQLSRASADGRQRQLRIVGRLRALDLDRTRIAIRSGDGTLWACLYPDDLAPKVIEAINRVVIAQGLGAPPESGRGQITLDEIEVVPEAVQTELFSREPASVAELVADREARPMPAHRLLPDDVTDTELDAFLAALGRD